MAKYTDESKQLLELVGGKENIASLSHCVTRLRFVLKNTDIADAKAIEELDEVKGTFTHAGQFQVIIGNGVSDYYKDFIAVSGVEEANKAEVTEAAKQNMNPLERAISVFADIFVPLLPAIIAGGLILGLRNVLGDIEFYGEGGTLAATYGWVDQLNSILWVPGEAIFHFLPVGVAWSTVKKFGGSEILGIVLGIMLVSPQLMNAYAFAGAQVTGEVIPAWDFGLLSIQKVGYQAQVLPAMFSGILLAKMEVFLNKRVHESIRLVVVPLVVLLVSLFFSYTIIGPISREIGNGIAFTFEALLTGPLKVFGAILFGLIYAPLVITGLHHTFLAVDLILIGKLGSTMIWPMIALSNIAQGSAALAAYFIYKDAKTRAVSSSATISAYLGVTEPALYGINIKFKYPFIAAIIGSATAAVFVTVFGVTAGSIGIGGLPGILSITKDGQIPFLIGMIIAIVIPIVLTFVFAKTKLNKDNTGEE
ncbi:trehalose-specific PTS enzyme IIB and IIC component [Erysipelotrichaceae bacterium]|nr:trehalose-specific PTS enzyme IIB and IIC component [Erysipelotrichaceae bacterium]